MKTVRLLICLVLEQLENEIYMNYTSQMILISAFIPYLLECAAKGKDAPRLVIMTSNLGIVPFADFSK